MARRERTNARISRVRLRDTPGQQKPNNPSRVEHPPDAASRTQRLNLRG